MNNEVEYASNLLQKGFLKKPDSCKCGMQKSQCRNRVPIRTNSFYNKFPKLTLRIVSEVIKCFLRELKN